MKTTHKLCAAALVALAGVAVATTTTKAAPEDALKWASSADIEFTKADMTDDTNKPSGSSEDTELPTNKEKGDLKVIAATPLKFGKQKVKNTTDGRTYNAGLHVANPSATNNSKYTIANYVHYKDVRSIDDHSYKLNVEMTKPFTSAENDKLAAATLTYHNFKLGVGEGIEVPVEKRPTVPTKGVTIGNQMAKATIIDNKDSGSQGIGWGDYYLYFGDKPAGTADKSVVLTVPTTDNILTKRYQAEVTWTLETTK